MADCNKDNCEKPEPSFCHCPAVCPLERQVRLSLGSLSVFMKYKVD